MWCAGDWLSFCASPAGYPYFPSGRQLDDVHKEFEALVRLVQQGAEHAAASHGPVRWLVLRVLPNLINYFNVDSHGGDPCYGPDDSIYFPDDSIYQTLDSGLDTHHDEDPSMGRHHHSGHDKKNRTSTFKPRTEKLHDDEEYPDMLPIFPMPSHNRDEFRR